MSGRHASSEADPLRRLLEQLISGICARATALQMDGSFEQQIGDLVPQDTTGALSAEQLLVDAFRHDRRQLLDFGCGQMEHRPFIESIGYHWSGIEHVGSAALDVQARIASHPDIQLYNGLKLPYTPNRFDVAYAMLVFHHLHSIDTSFAELHRVLRPGGRIIGQVAYLEQMQDFGTYGFTPYGLKVACERAGLSLARVFPKHDAFSFLARRLLITLGSTDDTPFNGMLDPTGFFHEQVIACGERLNLSVREINLLRLLFCTHFTFEIRKPSPDR